MQSRLWVFQEAALARRNFCFIRHFEIPLLDILWATQWMFYKHMFVPNVILDRPAFYIASELFKFVAGRYSKYASSERDQPEWWDLVTMTRHLRVTDPREQVFGMLGLKQWDGGIPYLLTPDYGKPVSSVLRDAARFALQDDNRGLSLYVWSSISIQNDDGLEQANHVSWVPATGATIAAENQVLGFRAGLRCDNGIDQPCNKNGITYEHDTDVYDVYGLRVCVV